MAKNNLFSHDLHLRFDTTRGGLRSKKMPVFWRKSGTIIEVNVSELGLVTQTGKVIFAKYAQVTNNPDPWMQMGDIPPNHPLKNRDFHYKLTIHFGVPLFLETTKCLSKFVVFFCDLGCSCGWFVTLVFFVFLSKTLCLSLV